MGLWPTRGNENQIRRPREGGDPFRVDSRLRVNDVHGAIFGGVVSSPPLENSVLDGEDLLDDAFADSVHSRVKVHGAIMIADG